MECIIDTCLCGLLFYAMGLRVHVQPRQWLHRLSLVLPERRPGNHTTLQGVDFLAVWIFQFAFAVLARPLRQASMIGRTAFVGVIFLYSVAVTGFIYPIIGHWTWGPDGFLATMEARATGSHGSEQASMILPVRRVVHTIGGFISLAASYCPWSPPGPQIQA